ncbi:glutathione S-transferase [Parasphingopyxis lamellibrachiae]|uniref:glutathione transferase n=1 Tax=Parasphingopyxis lamellibrachiae TaxID=680125 RepID=A0A3D9FEW3_9SPHN|nr:glutathione S-transferase [Parasphingopyxis lamellibrachiae]RED15611.1 glutathione S-transferase [Parasphingopyxis lamellibrachiae]
MTIIVHHLENSRSQRILWLLEELELEYEVVRYARDAKTMLAPPTLKRIHPLGKSPVISVDDRVVIETGAIVEYLVATAGEILGAPAHIEESLRYRQFLHYAEGSMMPPLLTILVINRLGILGRPARKPILAMFESHLRWLESELQDRNWFAGNSFTAADVMMSFPLEAARQRAGLDERYPNLLTWLDSIHERPAYQRALQRGGDYAYA